MVYGDFLYQIENFLSQFFRLPNDWFTFPSIIFYFIVPLISLVALWYKFLQKKLRIFRNSGVNFGISIIISFFSSFLIGIFGPAHVTGVAIGGTILVMGRFTFLRIIISIAAAIIIGMIYPTLVNLLI